MIPTQSICIARANGWVATKLKKNSKLHTILAWINFNGWYSSLGGRGLVHNKVGQTGSKHVMTSRFNLGQYIWFFDSLSVFMLYIRCQLKILRSYLRSCNHNKYFCPHFYQNLWHSNFERNKMTLNDQIYSE